MDTVIEKRSLPRANSLVTPKQVYAMLEEIEYTMLRRIAEKNDRPVSELIRAVLRDYVEAEVQAGHVERVEGYITPSEQVR